MARSKGTASNTATGTARKGSKGTPQAGTASNGAVPVFASLALACAAIPALAAAVAQVGHMQGGGPSAAQYNGFTAKGGQVVYCVTKTGQRSGNGSKGTRYMCTLHVVTNGTAGAPLAQVPSVSAGWVGTKGSGTKLAK